MAVIYETEHFIVESHEKPEVDRLEGGHVKISPKVEVADRTELPPQLAIELMRLTIVAGEALVRMMANIGVEIGRINYQDNGNWKPHLHIHLYGRAKNATMQKYGDPILPGHTENYRPLNEKDVAMLRAEIETSFGEEKYSDEQWGL